MNSTGTKHHFSKGGGQPEKKVDKKNKTSQIRKSGEASQAKYFFFTNKGLGAIRAKIGPTSDVDKIFSKTYSQYVLFINKYS